MATGTEQLMLDKLDKIFRILAVLGTRGMKRREQIALLNQAGLKPKDIGDFLGTSRNSVSVELVALRKAKGETKSRLKVQASRESE